MTGFENDFLAFLPPFLVKLFGGSVFVVCETCSFVGLIFT